MKEKKRLESTATVLLAFSGIIQNPGEDSSELYKTSLENVCGHGIELKQVVFDERFCQEWAKLFYGVSEKGTYSLTESFWVSGKPLIVGPQTEELSKLLVSFGLTNQSTLPDDHMVVLLQLLAFLFLENKFNEAQSFFNKHILNWWPDALKSLLNEPIPSVKPFLESLDIVLQKALMILKE